MADIVGLFMICAPLRRTLSRCYDVLVMLNSSSHSLLSMIFERFLALAVLRWFIPQLTRQSDEGNAALVSPSKDYRPRASHCHGRQRISQQEE